MKMDEKRERVQLDEPSSKQATSVIKQIYMLFTAEDLEQFQCSRKVERDK